MAVLPSRKARALSAECPTEVVLVTEDESIIAFSVQDELENAGYEVAGPFATVAASMNWLSSATPDLAVLDTNLRDGSARPVARELIRRRVSFVVYSGYQKHRNTVPEFDQGEWVEKPSASGSLVKALAGLAQARTAK
jgi:DNA-binding response OmpR family regulator